MSLIRLIPASFASFLLHSPHSCFIRLIPASFASFLLHSPHFKTTETPWIFFQVVADQAVRCMSSSNVTHHIRHIHIESHQCYASYPTSPRIISDISAHHTRHIRASYPTYSHIISLTYRVIMSYISFRVIWYISI